MKPKLFKLRGTEYVDPSAYSWLFTENIGQSVRYVIEIRRKSFPDNFLCECPKWAESGQYIP